MITTSKTYETEGWRVTLSTPSVVMESNPKFADLTIEVLAGSGWRREFPVEGDDELVVDADDLDGLLQVLRDVRKLL